MLKITMLDTTGRTPHPPGQPIVALFSVTAAYMQGRTEALEILVTDPQQETILRGRLVQHGVEYKSQSLWPENAERFIIDMERTHFEFRAEDSPNVNEELLAAAEHILAIFDHPTKSVTFLDGDKLRDAIEKAKS